MGLLPPRPLHRYLQAPPPPTPPAPCTHLPHWVVLGSIGSAGEDEVVHFAGSPTERWRNARVKRESVGAFLAGATQFEILLYADITPR